jgi:hypothetical protein
MEHALPRRTWSLCMTSENHCTVGPAGCTFSHAPEKHERVLVVEVPAAANKAAEEGGLPALREIWNQLDDLRQISSQGSLEDTDRTNARLKKIGDIQNFVRAEINNGIYRDQLREDTKRRGLMGQVFTGQAGSLAESWYQEGAADRASRQVANKAEVEPVQTADVAHFVKSSIRDFADFREDVERLSTTAHRATLKRIRKDIYDTIDARVRNSVIAALASRATPPATTGASTVLTARGAGQYYAKGSAWSDAVADAATPGSNVVGDGVTISNGSTYSMTKRWDGSAWQTMEAILDGSLLVTGLIHGSALKVGAVEIRKPDGTLILGAGGTLAAEVAAQAGQVAVPGQSEARYQWLRDWFLRGGARLEIDPWGHVRVTTAQMVDEAIDSALAAPSPAKESK